MVLTNLSDATRIQDDHRYRYRYMRRRVPRGSRFARGLPLDGASHLYFMH